MELELGHRTLGREELTADDPYTQGGDADRYHAPHLWWAFYQRLDMTTEPFSCPGYTALTCQEQGYQTDEFFRVAHPSRFTAIWRETTRNIRGWSGFPIPTC